MSCRPSMSIFSDHEVLSRRQDKDILDRDGDGV